MLPKAKFGVKLDTLSQLAKLFMKKLHRPTIKNGL